MNERYQAVDRIAKSHFAKVSDLAVIGAARTYFQFKEMPQETRDFIVDEIVPSVLRGEKRGLAHDAEVLLAPYEAPQVDGAENIPLSGPVLFIANHWGEGPLEGHWTHPAISREIPKRRVDSGNVAWVINGNLHLPISGLPLPFSSRYCRQTAEAYGQHIVSNDGNLHSGIRIIRDFRRGGAIGLYPEAEWSTHLKAGDENAGALVCALARTDGLICPVGVYSDLSDKLFVRFGRALNTSVIRQRSYPLPNDADQRKQVYGRVANFLMRKIDPLVHPKYRLSAVV